MTLAPIAAFTILAVVFAFSQIVAQKTKAILSAAFVIALTMIILFNTGILPKDIYDVSTILPIGGVLITILITGMGGSLDFAELKRQWKTVVIAAIGVSIATALLVVIGQFIIGRDYVMAGAPGFAGGTTATLIMTEALTEKGLPQLATFATLVLVFQNFIGIPIASVLLKKAAKFFVKDTAAFEAYKASEVQASASQKKRLIRIPKSINDISSVSLAKLALVGVLSYYVGNWLGGLTQGMLNYIVIALILGTVFTELGFLEKNEMEKSQSSGLIMMITLMMIFANLATTSIPDILGMIPYLVILLLIGAAGACVSGLLLGKVFKVNVPLAICMILTCMFGFPTTLLMSNEVAAAVGETDEQKEVLGAYLRPIMVTAGLITGIISIILAGVLAVIL